MSCCTNEYAAARRTVAKTMNAARSFISAASIALLVKGDAAQRGEERRVARHLQAEINERLDRHRDDAADRPEPQPVGGAVRCRQAFADGDRERDDRDHDG